MWHKIYNWGLDPLKNHQKHLESKDLADLAYYFTPILKKHGGVTVPAIP